MNENYMNELLSQLCEMDQDRFSVSYKNIYEPGWWFNDTEIGFYEDEYGLNSWLFDMLNELNITTINNLNGNSWRESVLDIIVNEFKER